MIVSTTPTRRLCGLAFPALLVGAWWLRTRNGGENSTLLVPFGELFRSAASAEVQRSLLQGLGATCLRLLEGSATGILAGLLLGTFLGLSKTFDRMMGPSFHAVRQVAIFAWIPLLTAWCGNGDLCKIIFIALAAFYPVAMGTYQGIRSVPTAFVEVGRVLCFSRRHMLRRVVLPSAAPSIVTAIQLALIYSWFSAIGSEYLIGSMSEGIGSVVMAAQEHLRTDVVLLGVILIAAVGIGMNTLLRRLPPVLFRWRDGA